MSEAPKQHKDGLYIVHSCTSISYSGLERYVVDLATWQKEQGYTVEVFCRKRSLIHEECRKRDIRCWIINEKQGLSPLLILKIGSRWRHLKQKCAEEGAELTLHMHHAGELRFHRLSLQNIAKKILQFHLWITHRKRNIYHAWLYAALNAVWCSSESAKEQLHKILPVAEKKIEVIPYGRKIKELKAHNKEEVRKKIRHTLRISEDHMVFLCISRIEKIKGIQELMDAFVSLAGRNKKVQLILVGGPSPGNDEAQDFFIEIQDQLAGLSTEIKSRIHLMGFVPDSQKYYLASDVYVLPSYEECMSLALLDALILGLPTIGTESGGTPSVVIPESTGLLVPPQNENALLEAMETVASGKLDLALMSQNAATLTANLDEDTVFQKIIENYRTA